VREHTPTVDPRSLANFTSRKATAIATGPLGETPDSLAAWVERYQALAVAGVRSAGIGNKIALHLARLVAFFTTAYGHDLRACYPPPHSRRRAAGHALQANGPKFHESLPYPLVLATT